MKFTRVDRHLGIIFDTPHSFFVQPNANGVGKPHIFYHCPLGRKDGGAICGVPMSPSPPNRLGAIWTWNGSIDAPTLTPSINCKVENGGCGWHGWITNGDWQP